MGAQATEALKITATELIKFEVMDEIIMEPPGGAHADPIGCFPAIKAALMENWDRHAAFCDWAGTGQVQVSDLRSELARLGPRLVDRTDCGASRCVDGFWRV